MAPHPAGRQQTPPRYARRPHGPLPPLTTQGVLLYEGGPEAGADAGEPAPNTGPDQAPLAEGPQQGEATSTPGEQARATPTADPARGAGTQPQQQPRRDNDRTGLRAFMEVNSSLARRPARNRGAPGAPYPPPPPSGRSPGSLDGRTYTAPGRYRRLGYRRTPRPSGELSGPNAAPPPRRADP